MNLVVEFLAVFVSGLLGVLGHWFNRYAQGRTTSTFAEYLSNNRKNTVASVFTILASCGAVYAALPPAPETHVLVLAAIGAYNAGYVLDSVVNRDRPQPGEWVDIPYGQAQVPLSANPVGAAMPKDGEP